MDDHISQTECSRNQNIIAKLFFKSVVEALPVESLPSNPAARVLFLTVSGISLSILGLGMCPLSSVLCCLWRWPDILLPQISGRPAPVYLSSVLVKNLYSPYRHLTHGHLGCKPQGSMS